LVDVTGLERILSNYIYTGAPVPRSAMLRATFQVIWVNHHFPTPTFPSLQDSSQAWQDQKYGQRKSGTSSWLGSRSEWGWVAAMAPGKQPKSLTN
jgi:hypothetical protein